jgi:hypothetical protein
MLPSAEHCLIRKELEGAVSREVLPLVSNVGKDNHPNDWLGSGGSQSLFA